MARERLLNNFTFHRGDCAIVRAMSKSLMTVLAVFVAIGAASPARSQSVAPGCVNDRYGNVQCPPPGGSCVKDRYDDIRCSPADGGILLDRYEVPVCGPGQCVTDIKGEVHCSRVAKGSAALDRYGDAVCTDGCVGGAAQTCITPSR